MKLTRLAPGGLTQTKEVPGLLACHLEYEIKSGTGTLDYRGPKFDPPMWHQVLSFFRWTHQEMQSESQVRLYVNTRLGRWGAWAFPQEARTGMNAREMATRETPEAAAARFASWDAEPSAEWLYFCTAHHHGTVGAFQSDTDEANERNQDGLHLTVGRMDGERHDLHARFYLGGNCFAPDLSRFWPLEPDLAARVPPTMHPELARFQMGEKVVADFPDAWRQNVIEVKREERPGQIGEDTGGWPTSALDLPEWLRPEQARRDLTDRGASQGFTENDLLAALQALQTLSDDPAVSLILETCLKHQVPPDMLFGEAREDESRY